MVFPAPAGVILIRVRCCFKVGSFPRTCGGDPNTSNGTNENKRVFPAPAGVILGAETYGLFNYCFPRTCGGDPNISHFGFSFERFSPHLRG